MSKSFLPVQTEVEVIYTWIRTRVTSLSWLQCGYRFVSLISCLTIQMQLIYSYRYEFSMSFISIQIAVEVIDMALAKLYPCPDCSWGNRRVSYSKLSPCRDCSWLYIYEFSKSHIPVQISVIFSLSRLQLSPCPDCTWGYRYEIGQALSLSRLQLRLLCPICSLSYRYELVKELSPCSDCSRDHRYEIGKESLEAIDKNCPDCSWGYRYETGQLMSLSRL